MEIGGNPANREHGHLFDELVIKEKRQSRDTADRKTEILNTSSVRNHCWIIGNGLIELSEFVDFAVDSHMPVFKAHIPAIGACFCLSVKSLSLCLSLQKD